MKSLSKLFLLLSAVALSSCQPPFFPASSSEPIQETTLTEEESEEIASSYSDLVTSLVESSEEETSEEHASEQITSEQLTSEAITSEDITSENPTSEDTSEALSSIDASQYWANLNRGLYGESFRTALQTLIIGTGNKSVSYSESRTYLEQSDKALNGQPGIIPFYHPDFCSTTYWNREHVWPDSRGAGKSGPGSDPQMLRPTASSCNSARGNNFYGMGANEFDPAQCSGDSDPYPLYEPARGEAARIIFYVAAKYGTATNMTLSNNPSDGTGKHTMGTLSYLIQWNNQYPVTAQEIRRNEYLHSQGFSRNPFIDDRDLANYIWDENGLRTSPYQGGNTSDDYSYSYSFESSSEEVDTSDDLSLVIGESITLTGSSFTSAYPTAETEYTINGVKYGVFNTATFDGGATIQLKNGLGYFYNKTELPEIDHIDLTVVKGTPVLCAGNGANPDTVIEATSGHYLLDGAKYFKIKNAGGGVINLSSVTIYFQ